MPEFTESLKAADNYLMNAQHLTYVTYNIIKEKRVLLNVLENLYKSILYSINAVLQVEAELKRVSLYKESSRNLEIFKKISKHYSLEEKDLKFIDDLIAIVKKHKESGLVFSKGGKVVIMFEDKILYFDLQTIKDYIEKTRGINLKIKDKLGIYAF